MTDLRSRVQQALSGSYTLERELGGGGMSKVFVADEHRLGRKVVVKLLSPELAAAMSTSRFEREIRVAASLQQANIVPVLAAGDLDGLPYYTMPYVEGESLRARLARGPLSITEALSILRDVSRALAYAHDHGVVHRDIKPDNVLLSGHTAVVTDFGIAKAIAAAATGVATSATLTQLGTAVGTPAYMAPEQAAGDPSTDHRADIYAFGCMAYELLASQPPFPGLPPHKLLVAHMSEAPTPLVELRPDCPPALAALVMQCLAKDPASRPGSATELLRRLDAVISPSAPQAAMPAILIGGRAMLWRALGLYALAILLVAIVARAAIIAIGLPDWVLPGALAVMALGLPVILFTAYTQHVSRKMATATPTYTPGGTPSLAAVHGTMATIALKASPHVSWKRTTRGGVIAVSVFAVLVAGFMVLRALGIGPAGSLLASGKLSASDKVLVAAFDAPGADTSLGSTIAEAVRTNLSQSQVVRLVPTSAVVSALEQMKRPDTSRVDYATAREIAQRTGAKAVVAGSIVPAGSGYIVTARLVAAESGDELASYRESATDAGDLIPSVDRLTKSLRGRIGESLKDVRAAPRLDQVTTASLGALRSYAAGLRANDIQGDPATATQFFQEAIRQDSGFAMAYVQLAYSLLALGGARHEAEAHAALTRAFELRDHLPERERYNVEGGYYMTVAPDRTKAIPALRRAVELDSTNYDAANSLAVTLGDSRDHAGAERMYRLALRSEPMNGTLLTNLAALYMEMGRTASFDSVMTLMDSAGVPFPTGPLRVEALWTRRDYDGAERLAQIQSDTAKPSAAISGQDALVGIAVARGRLREAERRYAQVNEAKARVRGDTVSEEVSAYFRAMVDGQLRGDVARGLATLDAAARARPIVSTPPSPASLWLAIGYASLGAAEKARELTGQYDARLDLPRRRQDAIRLARTRGMIALAEGKADSAIAWFRRGELEADGLPSRNCTVCTPLFLGLAFDRAGNADSARTYLAQYVEMSGTGHVFADRFYLAPALFRLGELYERSGDAARATEYYGRFVDLWSKADAELQPRVAEARSRIDHLNRTRR
jgi:tRNA A-37 threonylcarbamoyl transferase component Bud32/tetratricopeptide (TPR) repeat protein